MMFLIAEVDLTQNQSMKSTSLSKGSISKVVSGVSEVSELVSESESD